MKIQATSDNIYCRVEKVNERMLGTIIIPDSIQRTHVLATVVSIGEIVPEIIKIGNVLVMNKRAGQDIMMDDNQIFKVVKYNEVYGILEGDNNE